MPKQTTKKVVKLTEKYGSDDLNIVMVDGKPWFKAEDVVKILGFKDTDKAIVDMSEENQRTLKELLE